MITASNLHRSYSIGKKSIEILHGVDLHIAAGEKVFLCGPSGAGKTTLIRHLMLNPQGKRLAVLVNEFGTMGVDGEILKSCADENCPEENILELSNGCICCTVADDFIPTLERLMAMPVKPDHILIETSGLALPKPLLKAFDWPAIRSRITVDGVIALADAETVAAGRFAPDEAAVQAALSALREDAKAGRNIMPASIAAAIARGSPISTSSSRRQTSACSISHGTRVPRRASSCAATASASVASRT